MFCIPCEVAWNEEASHPALRAIGIDRVSRSSVGDARENT
jgi:hypothetical protein